MRVCRHDSNMSKKKIKSTANFLFIYLFTNSPKHQGVNSQHPSLSSTDLDRSLPREDSRDFPGGPG